MMQEILLTAKERIFEIQINRPEKKNALTQAMYTAMTVAIKQAEADHDIRVIVIRGGDDAFTAGNDIEDFLAISDASTGSDEAPVQQFMQALTQAKKPLVAAVNGLAIGIGTTLLLHCDLVYCGKSARFQLPFANLGLCPEFASSYVLPVLMGRVRASELLLLGMMFDAQKALDVGIVNAIIEDDQVYAEACYYAQKIIEQPPNAIRTTKALLKQYDFTRIDACMREELDAFFKLLKMPEAQEALQAFREKRKPDFSSFN